MYDLAPQLAQANHPALLRKRVLGVCNVPFLTLLPLKSFRSLLSDLKTLKGYGERGASYIVLMMITGVVYASPK